MDTFDKHSELYAELDRSLQAWGANRWGVADLTAVREELHFYYGAEWDAYDRAISAAVFFPRSVLNQILDGPTHTYQAYYDIVNARLNDIGLRTALWLEEHGYRAFPVPASQRIGPAKAAGIFSHRFAAQNAGLGWVGKSLSLVNPEVGPRLRLVTILTDAPLTPDHPLADGCPENCTACRDACPPGALKGVRFDPTQELAERFDREACVGYLRQVRQSFGKEICGRCLAACPYGRK